MHRGEAINRIHGTLEDGVDPSYRFENIRMVMNQSRSVPDRLMVEDAIAKSANTIHSD
jgi:hypothetical protein